MYKRQEYIRENKEDFRLISVRKIESIHDLLMEELGITRGIRKTLVRITGTSYLPLDNEFQIREALEKTCELVNERTDIFEKAVVLMLFIAYIQPFVDGNKRTSRPVSYTHLDVYKRQDQGMERGYISSHARWQGSYRNRCLCS